MTRSTLDALFEGAATPLGVTDRARSLLNSWERVRSGHVVLAAGCSCGLPAMHVSVADFETDLVDYLLAKWSGETGAVELIERSSGQIGKIVTELGLDALSPENSQAMLNDLETALRSFLPPVSPGSAQRVDGKANRSA